MQTIRRQTLLAVMLGVAVGVGVGVVGCDRSEGGANPLDDTAIAAGIDESGSDAGPFSSLTVEQIDARLHLSEAQRSQLQSALDELRSERRDRWGKRGHGGRGAGIGQRGISGGPPVVAFIEDVSKILTPDQFREMAVMLKETRDARIGRMDGRRHQGGGEEAAPFGLGRRAAAYLGLTESQQAQLRPIVKQHVDEIRGVRDSVRGGAITQDQARDRIRAIRQDMRDDAKSILTAEQWEKVESARRERMADAIDTRMDHLDEQLARRADILARVLGLDATQTQQVRTWILETIPARTEVLSQLRAGTIEPEDAAGRILEIEKAIEERIPPLLAPEQLARWEAIRDLLPMRVR
jgi:hypothetical protein